MIDGIISDFLYEVGSLDIIIRKLNNEDIYEYIFKEINYPYKNNEEIKST
jgi:hypothetical protein